MILSKVKEIFSLTKNNVVSLRGRKITEKQSHRKQSSNDSKSLHCQGSDRVASDTAENVQLAILIQFPLPLPKTVSDIYNRFPSNI